MEEEHIEAVRKLYVEKQQLHVNCLTDPDRNIRTRGLDTLIKNIFSSGEKVPQTSVDLLIEKMISPLLKLFEDKIEKIRQMAIDLIIKLIDNYKLDEKVIVLIINTVITRLNSIPFPETSEELRQNLINLLDKILSKYANDLLPVMSDLSNMISKLLTDACPEVKTKLSDFIIRLSGSLGKSLGPHSKAIVNSLSLNLKHAHNKIRKCNLAALIEVLLCENAGKFFEEAVPLLKLISNDKNYDVRKAFYSSIFKLLTNFNIIYLRKYEHFLTIFLMNGLSDEKVDIQESCLSFIEEAGEYRIKLAKELDEELPDLDKDSMIVDGQ